MPTAQQTALTRTQGATTVFAQGTLPRPPISPDGVIVPDIPISQPNLGIGTRIITTRTMRRDLSDNTLDGYGRVRQLSGPLPPVGESARRDPHQPDPYPSPRHQPADQQQASPRTPAVGFRGKPWHVAGGINDNGGYPGALTYVKWLGTLMASNLAKNFAAGNIDAMWRVGGISLPISSPPGFGYNGWVGDAQTLWFDNPQVYLRNPGVIPLTQGPTFWRYAPGGGIQPLGPSIGDVGTPAYSQLNAALSS